MIIEPGKHTVIYSLDDGAAMVASELAFAVATETTPFKLPNPLPVKGNALWIGHMNDDCNAIDLRFGDWKHDRSAKFMHRFEAVEPEDAIEVKPAIICRDLTWFTTAWQSSDGGSRRPWLENARHLAEETGAAVITAIVVEPRWNAKGQKEPQPHDLGDFADFLWVIDREGFRLAQVHPVSGPELFLHRATSHWNHLYAHPEYVKHLHVTEGLAL